VVSFLLASPQTPYMHLSSLPCVLHALPISPSLTRSDYTCWRVQVMKLLVIQFSSASLVHIFSSPSCAQIPSVFILP
jgi:hypothetical protein